MITTTTKGNVIAFHSGNIPFKMEKWWYIARLLEENAVAITVYNMVSKNHAENILTKKVRGDTPMLGHHNSVTFTKGHGARNIRNASDEERELLEVIEALHLVEDM